MEKPFPKKQKKMKTKNQCQNAACEEKPQTRKNLVQTKKLGLKLGSNKKTKVKQKNHF